MTTRRSLLIGGAALIAAPAVVRASSLMKVAPIMDADGWHIYENIMPLPYKEPSRTLLSLARIREELLPGLMEVCHNDDTPTPTQWRRILKRTA